MNDYILGFTLGFITVLAIALCVFLVIKKKTGGAKYDERQIIGRGKAFQAGFFTLLIGGALVTVFEQLELLPGNSYLWHMGVLAIGIGVFAVTAIHFDAYVSMNDTPKRFMFSGGCLALAMFCIGIANLLTSYESGRVTGVLNLMVGVLWLVILAALYLHNRNKAVDDE